MIHEHLMEDYFKKDIDPKYDGMDLTLVTDHYSGEGFTAYLNEREGTIWFIPPQLMKDTPEGFNPTEINKGVYCGENYSWKSPSHLGDEFCGWVHTPDTWNTLIAIRDHYDDEHTRKVAESLLGQLNTASGSRVKPEANNFIREVYQKLRKL